MIVVMEIIYFHLPLVEKKVLFHYQFKKKLQIFGVSTFQPCSLDGQIFISNPISFINALINPGDWQCGSCGIDVNNNGVCDDNEWQESTDVIIHYETPQEVSYTVPDYGLYEFRYFICDTFYRHVVGFHAL